MHRLQTRIGPCALLGWLCSCAADPIIVEGEFGRPISLASGGDSILPHLVFVDEGCPGLVAQGGCDATQRPCEPILIDSLAPLTTLQRNDGQNALDFGRQCLEVRSAAGLASSEPTQDDRNNAITRMRFRDLPLVRAPAAGDAWQWAAGNQEALIEPTGVLGGNLLREFAVSIRTPRIGDPTVTFFGEFPGEEEDLADQGRAFLPLQFPGRLLGRDVSDRCDIDGDPCNIGGLEISTASSELALESTRMVLDACIARPACGLRFRDQDEDGDRCASTEGPDSTASCIDADDPVAGGRSASLVVATGVPGLVLFDDSARQMFGTLSDLPGCDAIEANTLACIEGQDGALFVSGWPAAGDTATGDAPLTRLRVRSLAILPGLTESRDVGPCTRARQRQDALQDQCQRFVDIRANELSTADTTPPYSAQSDPASGRDTNDPAASSLAVLGEAELAAGADVPASDRWIETLVLPATHPLPLAVRRDVAPDALEPDGLLGSVLLDDTIAILDYTDPNPGVRLTCLDPREGNCLVAPDCMDDGQPACCFGLPLNLLAEFIIEGDDDTCCGALSSEELDEVQALGRCGGVRAP